jgi:hypothetical protein
MVEDQILSINDLRQSRKTQPLSVRLDPKTKFVIEFVARINGQSITTVVERAIKDVAERITIGIFKGNEQRPRKWSDFWDPNEGIRMLKLLDDRDYPTNYEEDELRAFIRAHESFFYSEDHVPNRTNVEILWPAIRTYLEQWKRTRSDNYWATGEAMSNELSRARVKPPGWPNPDTASADDV